MPTLRIVPPRQEENCPPDPDDAVADEDCEMGFPSSSTLFGGSTRGRTVLPEGIVFEIGFSWQRILAVVLAVLGAAVVVGCVAGPGALLGVGGGSVTSAVLLGGVVLVAGLVAVLGWVVVSWLLL
jgi:hypothetical protein